MKLDICHGIITKSPDNYAPINHRCEIVYDTETNLIWCAHRLDTGGGTHFSKFNAERTTWHKLEHKE